MSNALEVQLLLEQDRCKPGTRSLHALLRLEAGGRTDRKRPPLDLVACIDVSGSMAGGKLRAVQQALHALASELSAQDRLGITSFESSVHQVLPPTPMHAEGKAQLRAAVEILADAGSTFMSGGLKGAVSDLRSAPPPHSDAVRRVLLFTDGHANRGLAEDDRTGWSALLATELDGLSVSWFGFGEDHDAEFLAWLSDQSRGNAYVAKDEDAIKDAFAQELGGLLGVRATGVELSISVAGGKAVLLNEEKSSLSDGVLRVQLDDLSCEERKDLVLSLELPRTKARAGAVELKVTARWNDAVTNLPQSQELSATLAFATRPGDAPRTEVTEAAAVVFAANAQKRARDFAEQQRYEDAAAAIREAVQRLEAVGTPRAKALAERLAPFAFDYGDARSYGTSKSKLMAARRALSKQRSSGSDLDVMFLTEQKRDMQERFRAHEAVQQPDDTGAAADPQDRDLVRRLEDALRRARNPRRGGTT
ncbi:MAG: hypothetical protein RL653_534 [Pseudomonadota bacterium]|jgi:Mg-chelatase subunit ChlD